MPEIADQVIAMNTCRGKAFQHILTASLLQRYHCFYEFSVQLCYVFHKQIRPSAKNTCPT